MKIAQNNSSCRGAILGEGEGLDVRVLAYVQAAFIDFPILWISVCSLQSPPSVALLLLCTVGKPLRDERLNLRMIVCAGNESNKTSRN